MRELFDDQFALRVGCGGDFPTLLRRYIAHNQYAFSIRKNVARGKREKRDSRDV
jgi:hypothetical protein